MVENMQVCYVNGLEFASAYQYYRVLATHVKQQNLEGTCNFYSGTAIKKPRRFLRLVADRK